MDLHNHTNWSDGTNSVKEVIENAIAHKIYRVGITDHYHNVDCSKLKITEEAINKYIDEINKEAENYAGKIEIYAGLEIDVLPFPLVFNTLPYVSINKLDYILLENLDYLNPRIKLEQFEPYLQKIKCRIGLAHTDIYKLGDKYKTDGGLDYVLSFLKINNIFWELNSHSSRLDFDYFIYDTKDEAANNLIRNIRQQNIEVAAGSDTHDCNEFEYGRLLRANSVVEEYKLKAVKFSYRNTSLI